MNLSREDFRSWLVAKEPDELVTDGRRVCPGQAWLSEQLAMQVDCLAVGHSCVVIGEQVFPHHWLSEFGKAIDDRLTTWWENITAKQALEVFDSLELV